MRVLSWNLYHGRDFPPGKRPLLAEFAGLLEGLEWDVALLQEAPPRWFGELQQRTGSTGARVLTSRNWWPWLQGKLADWRPDLIKSSEGGSNQILVRSGRPGPQRTLTLTRWPERRRMQWVRLDSGVCVANLHASTRPDKASAEIMRAAEAAVEWAGEDPLVFGGDFNLRPSRQPQPFTQLRERFGLGEPTAPQAIDHILVRGLGVLAPPRQLPAEERQGLSDHAPVVAEFME